MLNTSSPSKLPTTSQSTLLPPLPEVCAASLKPPQFEDTENRFDSTSLAPTDRLSSDGALFHTARDRELPLSSKRSVTGANQPRPPIEAQLTSIASQLTSMNAFIHTLTSASTHQRATSLPPADRSNSPQFSTKSTPYSQMNPRHTHLDGSPYQPHLTQDSHYLTSLIVDTLSAKFQPQFNHLSDQLTNLSQQIQSIRQQEIALQDSITSLTKTILDEKKGGGGLLQHTPQVYAPTSSPSYPQALHSPYSPQSDNRAPINTYQPQSSPQKSWLSVPYEPNVNASTASPLLHPVTHPNQLNHAQPHHSQIPPPQPHTSLQPSHLSHLTQPLPPAVESAIPGVITGFADQFEAVEEGMVDGGEIESPSIPLPLLLPPLPPHPHLTMSPAQRAAHITAADAACLALLTYHDTPMDAQLWNLTGKSLGDDGTITIATALAHNKRVVELRLGSNGITERGAMGISQALEGNGVLEKLRLDNNAVGDAGATWIASALKSSKSLKLLLLNNNLIGDEGARQFGAALAFNRTLEWFNLDNPQITEKGVSAIARCIPSNRSIKSLIVGSDPTSESKREINAILLRNVSVG
eukprot:GHVN01037116.1.p1 GENE.GHVN01037116.1~~GHVN01037116.1.p1  ORF type:complete len:581 (+),score=161.97 GHVN01037116.1:229-1971(+)